MFGFLKKKLGDAISSFSDKAKEKEEEAPVEDEVLEEVEEPLEAVVEEAPSLDVLIPEKESVSSEEFDPLGALDEPEIKQAIKEKKEPKKNNKVFVELKERKIEDVKVKATSKIKQAIFGKLKFSDKEIEDFCWEFELMLLESDVEIDAAKKIADALREQLKVAEIKRGTDYNEFIKKVLREILVENLSQESFDLVELVGKKSEPFVVMFLGTNGAGKTTSIAKIVNLLKKAGKTSVLAAGDTFRAGSIQQLEAHANKLGVRVIKHDYGADAAAVSFDAIASAKSKGIDAVLIDTAGRQDTNVNLMDELKKIVRVAKPDLKVFVGEAIAGQALIEQIEKFNEAVGIDTIILTKLDADAKGGGAISILSKLKIPIAYVGVGQEYDDFLKFSPDVIIDRIL